MNTIKSVLLATLLAVSVGCEPTTPTTPTSSTVAPSTVAPPSTGGATSTTSVDSVTLRPSGGDDTSTFVDAAATHNTVVVDGPLRIDSPAVLRTPNRHIIFTGSGSLRRTARPAKRIWQVLVVQTVGITIDNLRIDGPNVDVCGFMWYPPPTDTTPDGTPTQQPRWIEVGYAASYEAQHGLEISGGASNVTVNGGRIYGMSGDGVYIAGGAHDVTITDLTTECTGRSSISNVGSERVTVNGGSFHRSGLWIFNVEPFNTFYVHDYTIKGARVGYSNWQWLIAAGPDFSCDVRNVNISADLSGGGFDLHPNDMVPNIAGCVSGQFHVSTSR